MAKEQSPQDVLKRVQKQRRMIHFIGRLTGRGKAKVGKEVMLETEAGTVRTLFYGFEDETVKPVLFDMHGGGFILMNADADEALNISVMNNTNCKVISIDYGLAPEHPFPKAVDQVYAVVKEVHAHAETYRIDSEKMAIGGYSAGGNLAAVTCIQAKQKGDFSFVCQVLVFPPLDLATSPYNKPCPKGAITPEDASLFDACYIDPQESKNPLVSPVYAKKDELTDLPPALLILAGLDSLHDEGATYGKLLEEAGVPVDLHEFPEEKHGFTYFRSKGVGRALDLIAEFINTHL